MSRLERRRRGYASAVILAFAGACAAAHDSSTEEQSQATVLAARCYDNGNTAPLTFETLPHSAH